MFGLVNLRFISFPKLFIIVFLFGTAVWNLFMKNKDK